MAKKLVDLTPRFDSVPGTYVAQIVNPCATTGTVSISTYSRNDRKHGMMSNITFSASGLGKFSIIFNDVVVATLFNDRRHLHVTYLGTIHYNCNKDVIKVQFCNRDLQAQDMYVGWIDNVQSN